MVHPVCRRPQECRVDNQRFADENRQDRRLQRKAADRNHIVLPLSCAVPTSHQQSITQPPQATVDYEAQDEAVLAKILIPAGTPDVPVGTPMMVLIEDLANAAAFKDFSVDADTAGGSESAAPSAPAAAPAPAAAAPAPEAVAAPAATPVSSGAGGRVFASPLAKLVSGAICGLPWQGKVEIGDRVASKGVCVRCNVATLGLLAGCRWAGVVFYVFFLQLCRVWCAVALHSTSVGDASRKRKPPGCACCDERDRCVGGVWCGRWLCSLGRCALALPLACKRAWGLPAPLPTKKRNSRLAGPSQCTVSRGYLCNECTAVTCPHWAGLSGSPPPR